MNSTYTPPPIIFDVSDTFLLSTTPNTTYGVPNSTSSFEQSDYRLPALDELSLGSFHHNGFSSQPYPSGATSTSDVLPSVSQPHHSSSPHTPAIVVGGAFDDAGVPQTTLFSFIRGSPPSLPLYAPDWSHHPSPNRLMVPSPALTSYTAESSDDSLSLPATPHSMLTYFEPSTSPLIHVSTAIIQENPSPMPQRSRVASRGVVEAAERRRKRPHKWFCTVPGCDSKFTTHQNWLYHRNFHNGERPFQCDVPGCGKAYCTPSDMKRHARRCRVAKCAVGP